MMPRYLAIPTIVATIALGIFVLTYWPRINDVETGKTPEYPDLCVRTYAVREERVLKATGSAIRHLPHWTLVGTGSGPGGSEVQAVAESRMFHFKNDITIRIKQEGKQTKVTVRSRSPFRWDFGRNARAIREFLAALDREVS